MNKKYSIDEIKSIAAPIAAEYGVSKLALFGSYATGSSHENSDIDFVIEPGEIRGLAFFGFAHDLEEKFGIRVDVLTYDSIPQSKFFEPIQEVVLYET